jgi:ADP-ribose pyrophosphatase
LSKNDEKVVSSRLVYSGKIIRLRKDAVVVAGRNRATREILEHPGSVGIVGLLDDGKVLLIRQFRLATGKTIWEIPAGTMEAGEKPEGCAKRELLEETGYAAGVLDHLFDCYLAPGYSTEMMHLFVATSLERHEQQTEEDEHISVRHVSPAAALRKIRTGEIVDVKTIAALSYLDSIGRFGRPQEDRRGAPASVKPRQQQQR